MRNPVNCLPAIILCTVSILLGSCAPSSAPEEIAEQFIDQAESAFENRSIKALRKLVSSEYQDERKRDANDIVSIAATYIMRSRSIYLFCDLESASRDEERIQATVLAAFASRPVTDRNLLLSLNTDIYFFDILLTEEGGDWKLAAAEWRQAMVEDVMGDGD